MGFVWTDGDIAPTNSGPKDYMSVDLQMRGIYNTSEVLTPGLYDISASRIISTVRSTTATYIDDDGILRTAAVNVPRYEGGKLLVEGETTNLCLQSQSLNSSPWFGDVGVVSSAETYRGAAPFWTLAKTVSSGSEFHAQNFGSVAVGQAMSLTMALMAGSVTVLDVGLYDVLNFSWGLPEDSTAEVIEGPGVLERSTGALFFVSALSATIPTVVRITRTYRAADAQGLVLLYPGGAASTTIGHSVKATRVQIDQSGTSYIPTTTAPVTRSADIITVAR
jgi:hypothetical protein